MRYKFTVHIFAVKFQGEFQNSDFVLLFKHDIQKLASGMSNQPICPSIFTVLTIVEMKALLPILPEVSHCTIFSGIIVIPSLMRYTIRAYDVASTAMETSVS
jgi:hypothetical protein